MQIRIRATGQVLLEHEWIKWVATTYAKSISAMTADIYNRFDSDAVFEGAQATGGTVYQYSQRDGIEQQSDGKWYTKHILAPVFTDGETTAVAQEAAYKAIKDTEQAKSVRTSRDALLAECDWVAVKAFETGSSVSAQWATYRQALRDIPDQADFPITVTWPDKP